MLWRTKNPLGHFTLRESIEIGDRVDGVFAHWNRYDDFPRFMDNVRRTKRIDEQRLLWDVDIAGHQVVWEARIVEVVPEKLIRWESSWGASNFGEVRFEALSDARTRLTVDIEYRPRGSLEHLGARIGLAEHHVRHDLERFRQHVENLGEPRESSSPR